MTNTLGTLRSTVSVLLGKGDGTFQLCADGQGWTGTNLSCDWGIFGNDGRLDFGRGKPDGEPQRVRTGNRASGQRRWHVPAGSKLFWQGRSCYIVTADFNLDGKLDLAVTNPGAGAKGYITVLMGNGNGAFKNP